MGVEEAGADSALAHTHDFADLSVRHVLDVEHDHYGALRRGELLDGAVEALLEFVEAGFTHGVAVGGELAVVGVLLNGTAHVLQGHGAAFFAALEKIEGGIHRDGMHPSVEAAFAAEAREAAVGEGEGVLERSAVSSRLDVML